MQLNRINIKYNLRYIDSVNMLIYLYYIMHYKIYILHIIIRDKYLNIKSKNVRGLNYSVS